VAQEQTGPSEGSANLSERQRAVALAKHLREQERLTIAEIADRLGRSPSTVAGYFVDPDGLRNRKYKLKQQGRCQECGGPTSAKAGVKRCRSCWRDAVRQAGSMSPAGLTKSPVS
jgi:ribosomal protein S14